MHFVGGAFYAVFVCGGVEPMWWHDIPSWILKLTKRCQNTIHIYSRFHEKKPETANTTYTKYSKRKPTACWSSTKFNCAAPHPHRIVRTVVYVGKEEERITISRAGHHRGIRAAAAALTRAANKEAHTQSRRAQDDSAAALCLRHIVRGIDASMSSSHTSSRRETPST